MSSILIDSSKKLLISLGVLFLVFVIFVVIKTTSFIIGDILPYTKVGTIILPSSNQQYEFLFNVPADSNYILELHQKKKSSHIPEQIMQKCITQFPRIPFDFEAIKKGVSSKKSMKNLDDRVKRDSKRQACVREYLTGIANWTMKNKNGENSVQGFLPNIYSHGRPSNKLRSKFYYGLGIIKEIKKGDQVIINLDIPKQHYEKKNVTEYIIYMKRVN